jgi:hypothetical protein
VRDLREFLREADAFVTVLTGQRSVWNFMGV